MLHACLSSCRTAIRTQSSTSAVHVTACGRRCNGQLVFDVFSSEVRNGFPKSTQPNPTNNYANVPLVDPTHPTHPPIHPPTHPAVLSHPNPTQPNYYDYFTHLWLRHSVRMYLARVLASAVSPAMATPMLLSSLNTFFCGADISFGARFKAARTTWLPLRRPKEAPPCFTASIAYSTCRIIQPAGEGLESQGGLVHDDVSRGLKKN